MAQELGDGHARRARLGEGGREGGGLGEAEADPEPDADEERAREKRESPAPGLELLAVERLAQQEEEAVRRDEADRRAELGEDPEAGAMARRRVFDGEERGAAPLAAEPEALAEAQQAEERGRDPADLRMGREERDQEGRDAHDEERRDERRLPAHPIAEMPERDRAEGPREEGDREARVAQQQLEPGLVAREEERPEHERRGGRVDVEVVELDRRADERGEQDPARGGGRRSIGRAGHPSRRYLDSVRPTRRISRAILQWARIHDDRVSRSESPPPNRKPEGRPMANESSAGATSSAESDGVHRRRRAALVHPGAASSSADARVASRIAKLLEADPRFFVVRGVAEAIAEEPCLVLVPTTVSPLEESLLLERARRATTSGVFFSDDDARRIELLRAGATDVLSLEASDSEIVCRIERLIDTALRAQDALERQSELESLAYTDGLTGLANRRFFDEILKREVARTNRYRRPMSLVLIDLDHFKQVNDLLGHSVGDRVLVQVARQLQISTRTSDCAARLGGDELGAVLGDIDATGARIYATRILKSLANVVIDPARPELQCSLSIGIASYGVEPTTPAEMIRRADQALYRAKALGRGRVEIESW